MFRPNRIGTPNIHTQDGVSSTSGTAFFVRDLTDTVFSGNVINASPDGEFAYRNMNWTGGKTIAIGKRAALIHQFTVEKPLKGDVGGIELIGHIVATVPPSVLIVPHFGRLTAAAGSLLGAVDYAQQPSQLDDASPIIPGANTLTYRSLYYRTQVIARTDSTYTYGHGFTIYNSTGAPFDISHWEVGYAVRQLNDQTQIGYRDTLR